jgi:hypothetical protein
MEEEYCCVQRSVQYEGIDIICYWSSPTKSFLVSDPVETQKQTPWSLVRKRTIPTERPPLVDEILVPTSVDRGVSRGQRGGSPAVVNLIFLDRSHYFKVAPHLSSQGLSGPRSRPTATQKIW